MCQLTNLLGLHMKLSGMCDSTARTRAVDTVCAALLLPSVSGQGYIWLAHRDPASPSWPLARRSKAMWQQLAAAAGSSALGQAMEWQVGTHARVKELCIVC
jgi:hypothetical protein